MDRTPGTKRLSGAPALVWGGRTEVAITEVREVEWLSDPTEGVGVHFELMVVAPLYNVMLSYRGPLREDLSYGFIGPASAAGEVFYGYDALHDPEARGIFLRGFT